MNWWAGAAFATWAAIVIFGPAVAGHAFLTGIQEGYRQRVKDEHNGIPATMIVPLPKAEEQR